MSRPKAPHMPRMESIIFEEYNKFMFEIFEKSHESEYEIIHNKKFGIISYDIYRFKTKKNNSYDVDFYEILLNSNKIKLNDNNFLSKHIVGNNIINAIDIGFTRSNIDRDSENGDNEYRKRTNKNEQYEVLGKVAFMVEEYIKNNTNIFCYVVGKDTYESNLVAYRKMFENIFSAKFQIFEGNNDYHENGAYYFIKKDI